MSFAIIKGGKNEFVGHCKWCGCDFRYTEDEIGKDPMVEPTAFQCPHCKRWLQHCGEHGTSSASPFSQYAGIQNAFFKGNQG